MATTNQTKTINDLLDEQIIKINNLREKFINECDSIQKKTEDLLDRIPKKDNIRRVKILNLHSSKLNQALNTLQTNLDSLSLETNKEIDILEESQYFSIIK